jgi:Holliday junction resolvase RusA-like endonuclease
MKIIVRGNPLTWKRPGFRRFGKTYDQQRHEKNQWIKEALPQITEKLRGQVSVAVKFYLKRPRSHYGTGRNSLILKKLAPDRPTVKRNDIDNMVKILLDCLNDHAYHDDGQVVELTASKHYSLNPRTEIEVGR